MRSRGSSPRWAWPTSSSRPARFSYCNTGYAVLGRLIEVLCGKPFHDVLHEHLVTPLGLNTVAATPYEAILHRAAVRHTGVSKGQKAFLRVVPSAGLAVAVLTNSTNGVPLAHDIFNATGIETPPPPTRNRSTTACTAPTAIPCTTSHSTARR